MSARSNKKEQTQRESDDEKGTNASKNKEIQSIDMKEFNALNDKVMNAESNEIEEQRLDDLAQIYA